tara:strand:- start:1259 stop:1459 length:201 start_codon:yes stop_codon:yes gene_type:complete
MKQITANQLRNGDIIAFNNPRYNEQVGSVERTRDGDILVRHRFADSHGDYLGTSFYAPHDTVLVIR